MKIAFFQTLLLALALATPSAAQVVIMPSSVAFPTGTGGGGESAHPEAKLWLVQSTDGDGDDGYGGDGGSRNPKGVRGSALNKGVTKSLVKILGDANRTCDQRIELAYRIDCLRIYYGWVADELPETGDYAPIKKAMRRAEAKLDAIVRANLDTKEPAITPREGHKKNAKRMPPIRPVKPAAAKKAAAQAVAVVEEMELVILRSGEDPSKRKPHFTEVAAAVEDNLVVLRSA